MNRCHSLIALVIVLVLGCAAPAQQMAPTGQEAVQAIRQWHRPTKFSKLAEAEYEYSI